MTILRLDAALEVIRIIGNADHALIVVRLQHDHLTAAESLLYLRGIDTKVGCDTDRDFVVVFVQKGEAVAKASHTVMRGWEGADLHLVDIKSVRVCLIQREIFGELYILPDEIQHLTGGKKRDGIFF